MDHSLPVSAVVFQIFQPNWLYFKGGNFYFLGRRIQA